MAWSCRLRRSIHPWIYLFVLALGILTSCNKEKRHHVLTFFFDGVPPREGEQTTDTVSIDPRTGHARPEVIWTVHEPQKNCARCHGAKQQRNFSREVNLVAPVPALCYQCHTPPTQMSGWVHGPVAAGDCTFCHEPHRTVTPHLLKKPVPELCFRCHDVQAIRAIDKHREPAYASCLDCHSGHASTESHLLKPHRPTHQEIMEPVTVPQILEARDFFEQAQEHVKQGKTLTAVGTQVANYIQEQNFIAAQSYLEGALSAEVFDEPEQQILLKWLQPIKETLETQRLQREQAVTEQFLECMEHYRAGRLEQAQQGLRDVLESDAIPAPIQAAAQAYLQQVDAALASSGQGGEP